ncbi:DUF4244 domain-containing protein [Sphaerisporangium aureirubrum]|uniref:DUF4244 domain-containing protein n=1 Tax=Sphaerisporangium aureirubrum TaxID=1544736 RepID=A0ABW1NC00_9ACTN
MLVPAARLLFGPQTELRSIGYPQNDIQGGSGVPCQVSMALFIVSGGSLVRLREYFREGNMRSWVCSQGRHAVGAERKRDVLAVRRVRRSYGEALGRIVADRCRGARAQARALLNRLRASNHRALVMARTRAQAGMSTAEYAVGTIAACAFAGLLYKIVTSPDVRKMLTDIIGRALRLAG